MMNWRTLRFLIVSLTLTVTVLAACGGTEAPPPTVQATTDLIAESVNQTVAAIAVAQTVAALTGGTATEAPPATATTALTSDQPSATPEVAPLVTEQPPPGPTVAANQPPVCTTVGGVFIRSGPGAAYEPPIGVLAANAALTPLSYVARGFPQGEWLEVQIVATGQTAWVTAGSQFVTCSVAPSSLPAPANIPPTPRPTATPTTLPPTVTPTRVVANLPPNVQNDVPGGQCERTDNIKTRIEVDPGFLYRVYARDDRAGQNDGDGIDFVRFTISDASGQVYQREERTAGYCIFQGGEPDCRLWPLNDQGQFTWGQGGPPVSPGTYQVFIEVVSKEPDPATESNTCNWNFDMTVTLP